MKAKNFYIICVHSLNGICSLHVRLLLVLLWKKMPLCNYQNILTVKVLDSAPVLCPPPEEPTLSRGCLPQSEKDEKNVLNSFGRYYALHFTKAPSMSFYPDFILILS